jgi:hypothetical protein|tara:strand:+ start:356 stop:778 length:423 start_codon:yes stop_codon:yes gene_type:complete
MIKYNLKCENNHEFESWFSDSSEFERLRKKKLLECILCPSKNIKKSIMAPMISVPNVLDKNDDFSGKDFLKEKNRLKEIRSFIEKNFEYVGKNFSKRVREIYYDKKSQKAIYGNTTPEEREELAEEGIDLLSVPWVSKDN